MPKRPTKPSKGKTSGGTSGGKGIRLLAVLSDLHAGSTVALCPPDHTLLEGQQVRHNAVQAWLWDCWKDCTQTWLPGVVGADPWALVVNGDAIEGCHHGTTQVISPDPLDHLSAATALLAPLAELCERVLIVKGTEVHTGNLEAKLGFELGAVVCPETKAPCFDRLTMDIAGCRVVARHHMPTTGRAYLEASQLSIQLGTERIEAARAGHPIPQVLLAAHRHRVGSFTDGLGLMVVTGAWQALTRFGHKAVSPAVPVPAAAVLDWRNRADGELPEVHLRHYVPAAPAGVRL